MQISRINEGGALSEQLIKVVRSGRVDRKVEQPVKQVRLAWAKKLR